MEWKKVKLGDILKESIIESMNPSPNKRIRVKLNARGVEKRPVLEEKEGATKQYIRKAGQFIYGKQNLHKGAFGIIPKELDCFESSSDIPAFDIAESCIPEWIDFYFKSGNYYLELEKYARGVATKRISSSDFYTIEIPLPNIDEQKLVIRRFSNIINKHRIIITELDSQQGLLKKLRQSILQEAIEGKLTVDWRKENKDIESASKLLKRIKAEKEQLIKDKKIKKEKTLPPIKESEKSFALPEGWEWRRLGDICSKTGAGSTPRGGQTAYCSSGIKFIRSQNVYNDRLIIGNIAFIPSETHEKMKGTKVLANDLLLNITGGSIGRCCIVPNEFDTGNINQHVSIIRLSFVEMSNYVHKIIVSPYFQQQIFESQTGAGREGLPKIKMDNILIPIPPIYEQNEIVKKIEELFSNLNNLGIEVENNKQLAENLMQSVLKKAFEVKI